MTLHKYKDIKKYRDSLNYETAKQMLITARGVLVEMLDLAFEYGDISQRERDVMYYRLIDWHSLGDTGYEFGITKGRINQIEFKVEMILQNLTKNETD